eukprot:7143270-Prymnesium_polylepis.1
MGGNEGGSGGSSGGSGGTISSGKRGFGTGTRGGMPGDAMSRRAAQEQLDCTIKSRARPLENRWRGDTRKSRTRAPRALELFHAAVGWCTSTP